MIISFVKGLGNNTRFFEEVLFDFGALDYAVVIKMYIDVLSEPRGIIVSYCFSVTKGCKINTNYTLTLQYKLSIYRVNNLQV